jgi:hypothetical protein
VLIRLAMLLPVFASSHAYAKDVFQLRDGTLIKGEILGYADNCFVLGVRSMSSAEKVQVSTVRDIEFDGEHDLFAIVMRDGDIIEGQPKFLESRTLTLVDGRERKIGAVKKMLRIRRRAAPAPDGPQPKEGFHVGAWMIDDPEKRTYAVVIQKGDEGFDLVVYSVDGPREPEKLVEVEPGKKFRRQDRRPNDYFLINAQKDLELWKEHGRIATLEKISN